MNSYTFINAIDFWDRIDAFNMDDDTNDGSVDYCMTLDGNEFSIHIDGDGEWMEVYSFSLAIGKNWTRIFNQTAEIMREYGYEVNVKYN